VQEPEKKKKKKKAKQILGQGNGGGRHRKKRGGQLGSAWGHHLWKTGTETILPGENGPG